MAETSGYLRALDARIRRGWGSTSRPSRVNLEVQDLFDERVQELFRNSMEDSGRRWRTLAESTLRFKRGPRMLIETGKLYRSLTNRNSRFAVRLVSRRGTVLELGTKAEYAKHVNKVRPFLPFRTRRTRRAMANRVLRVLVRGRLG